MSSDTCTHYFAQLTRGSPHAKEALRVLWLRITKTKFNEIVSVWRIFSSSLTSYSSHICFCFRILRKLVFFQLVLIFFSSKYRQRLFVVLLGKKFLLVRYIVLESSVVARINVDVYNVISRHFIQSFRACSEWNEGRERRTNIQIHMKMFNGNVRFYVTEYTYKKTRQENTY